MDNINSVILLNGYGLRLISGTRSRSGLICRTDKGLKELKKIYYDERTVIFEDAVKRHLKQRGFDSVRLYVPTVDGTPFFNYEDMRYVLEEYIPTQTADLSDESTLKKAVITLADMHNLTEDFSFNDEKTGADLFELYAKRERELWRCMKRIRRLKTMSGTDRLVVNNGERFVKRAEQAIAILEESGYKDFERKVICHNCYKGDNIRLDCENEKIVVSGFSKCARDLAVADLAELIRRIFKDTMCSAEKAEKIIGIYCEKRPLEADEIKIMYAMLMYPAKFFKLCNKFYNKRRSFISCAVEEKFLRCCILAESEERFLTELAAKLSI